MDFVLWGEGVFCCQIDDLRTTRPLGLSVLLFLFCGAITVPFFFARFVAFLLPCGVFLSRDDLVMVCVSSILSTDALRCWSGDGCEFPTRLGGSPCVCAFIQRFTFIATFSKCYGRFFLVTTLHTLNIRTI